MADVVKKEGDKATEEFGRWDRFAERCQKNEGISGSEKR